MPKKRRGRPKIKDCCGCRVGYEKKIASEREWLCSCYCHKE